MSYKYNNPTERGYKKFKVSRKIHNELMPNRKRNVFNKIEAYYKHNQILFEYSTNLLGKIVTVLITPYVILMHGLGSLGELRGEFSDIFNPKKRGSFTSGVIHQKLYNGEFNGRFIALEELHNEQNRK